MRPLQYAAIAATIFLAGCGGATIPTDNVTDSNATPKIWPDYTGITMPPNIAPLNFEISEPGHEYVTTVTGKNGQTLIADGKDVKWDIDEWHALLEANKGSELEYAVFVKNDDGSWKRHKFINSVAREEIDPFISYRLIEPSFNYSGAITINQRNLTNFEEEPIFNNTFPFSGEDGFCMNCHVPRDYNRDHTSQFHVRLNHGGTMILRNGEAMKVNLKTDSTISAGVYPAWHPTLDLIAYSTNHTLQYFFQRGSQKAEVLDTVSDLVLYDIEGNLLRNIANDPEIMETFPAWSPDGKKIYYSAARYPAGIERRNLSEKYDSVRYDILCRDFFPDSMTFGKPDTIVYASSRGRSALLPRISPDGKYLLFCEAHHGTFHIWHKDSDLFAKNLETGEETALTEANSNDVDSYHTWSSNGRWIVFSSRRDDGSYTRPYFTYFSENGKASKAFILPQETADGHRTLMKSYNVPEFMVLPVNVPRRKLNEALMADPKNAVFSSK